MADVTVIIPCYNCADYVGEAIQSVLDQTDTPDEIMVVDDGSTDGSAAIVEKFTKQSQGRVHLIQQKNGGVSRARNVAIDKSHCKYIAFLDADDLWLPEKTTLQLAKLEQDSRAVGAHTRCFDFKDEIDDMDRKATDDTKDNPSIEEVIMTPYLITSCIMIRRSALGDIRFDETTGHSEDLILFGDLRLKGRWRLVDEAVVAKRRRDDQATALKWHRIWALETRVKWIRENATQIGTERADHMENQLVIGTASFLESLYWQRDLNDLKAMRERIRALNPEVFGKTFIASARIYPKWIYKLRDKIAS